ncbi:hypothetical protein [Kingella negevensis]|uniref:Uncharacterized protein n=1 Tax=Kingella negevensis TaxID=1522312 RepID=A0A238HHG4_9NEIS|nr:hypothetical protein [Kingella negevensis]MDK4679580.1 hypothetical protein [Kingella negevensis]MDK4682702.1 hypothetical protein [Kingella negevensis]MDK4685255.1 hypothetical protein [Kingella negevensis]MDK4689020.1 hypothetical protein [Kingella negevensis]MDK4690899.1 hypothetical protein [Kingella negevensis]
MLKKTALIAACLIGSAVAQASDFDGRWVNIQRLEDSKIHSLAAALCQQELELPTLNHLYYGNYAVRVLDINAAAKSVIYRGGEFGTSTPQKIEGAFTTSYSKIRPTSKKSTNSMLILDPRTPEIHRKLVVLEDDHLVFDDQDNFYSCNTINNLK